MGFLYLLNLTAFLSLNLCIINLLPIPALDGGRLMFLFIEMIRRKPIEAEKEGFINFIGFVALMILAVVIAYKDLIKFNLLNFFR
ncbi:Regulator of sigma-W protease RasP [bioreactor metagenome]|uniref:Regulator of sigma-W protease RasP n=1 Tax=bioreactor metagenome TaxID=1076179 RepID=A0A645B701_9ZZZZ